MSPQKRTSSETRSKQPISVTFVAFPGIQLLDLVGPLEVFDAANKVRAHRGQAPAYRLSTVAASSHIPSASGLAIAADPIDRAAAPHTLIVPGGVAMATGPIDRDTLSGFARLAAGAERIVSVCAGSFALGELGLLDGRRCTSHWLTLDEMRRRFPDAEVAADALYVDDHPIYTAAGVTAGIDLALYLLERDLGSSMALTVARLLVVFLHRPGGQSQFSASLAMRSGADQRIRDLVREVAREPAADHRVEALAARVGMSARHFARVFREQTGKTPAVFVEQIRVEAARRCLELSDDPVAKIAGECGFGTEETLRRSFHRALGIAPTDYRRRFHV